LPYPYFLNRASISPARQNVDEKCKKKVTK